MKKKRNLGSFCVASVFVAGHLAYIIPFNHSNSSMKLVLLLLHLQIRKVTQRGKSAQPRFKSGLINS